MVLYQEGVLSNIKQIFEKDQRKIKILDLRRFKKNEIVVDMPRREKFLHGSTFTIECNKPEISCNIKGEILVEKKLESKTSLELEKSSCKILNVHRWKPSTFFPIDESHLHFNCNNKNPADTLKIINILKDY